MRIIVVIVVMSDRTCCLAVAMPRLGVLFGRCQRTILVVMALLATAPAAAAAAATALTFPGRLLRLLLGCRDNRLGCRQFFLFLFDGRFFFFDRFDALKINRDHRALGRQ